MIARLLPLMLSLSKHARQIARAALFVLIATGLLHILQQCLAGFVQCRALGCLPWGQGS